MLKITLENIGPITKADLELRQITVIVGENNVGKSFVLKSVYSVFKAFEMERILLRDEVEKALRTCRDALSVRMEFVQEFLKDEELKERIGSLLRDIEFYLKEDILTLESGKISKLVISTADIVKKIDETIKKILTEEDTGEFVFTSENLENLSDFIEKLSIALSKTLTFFKTSSNELERLHEKIRSLESDEERLKKAWKILVNDIFLKDIVKFDSNKGKITIGNTVFINFNKDIQVKSRGLSYGNINNILNILRPVFVESPLLLEIKPYLAKTTERKIKSLDLPIHIGSFFDYIETISRLEEDEILEELKKIIGGEVYYSIDEGKFYFKSKQYEKPFDIQNVASGIKSFGILQLLLRSGASENMIFFWEEPESHLHPEWQIKFAEIVAKIVKRNNYFVISTHSPFMVEILRVVAKENDIDANFYYMDKNSELIEVNDENWDIISDSLLEPLREIAFRLFKVT